MASHQVKETKPSSTTAPQVAPESSVTPDNGRTADTYSAGYILHGCSFVFSVIALACAVAGYSQPMSHYSSTEFFLFVAASAFILNMIFVSLYLVHPKTRGMVTPYKLAVVEAVIAAIWTVFWFSGATAFAADKLDCRTVAGISWFHCDTSTLNAAVVFGYFAFFVWAALTAFAALHVFRARNNGVTTTTNTTVAA